MKELCQTSGQSPAVLRDNNGHVSHQFAAPCSGAVHNLPNEDIIAIAVCEDLKACLAMFAVAVPPIHQPDTPNNIYVTYPAAKKLTESVWRRGGACEKLRKMIG